jgi:hypothetical protein
LNNARALANQKLYFANVLLQMLRAELLREELPAAVLLEAVGQSVRAQLLDAYGWFLLELAETGELPAQPPHSVAELRQSLDTSQPLRGELVELSNLENAPGWLADLQALRPQSPPGARHAADTLQLMEPQWSARELEQWSTALAALVDRMSDSLDEW